MNHPSICHVICVAPSGPSGSPVPPVTTAAPTLPASVAVAKEFQENTINTGTNLWEFLKIFDKV